MSPDHEIDDAMEDELPPAPPLEVVLCIDHDALVRLRAVVRHLCVGLVDLNVKLRVVSPSSEAAPLGELGPIQVVWHEPLRWPTQRGTLRRIQEALAPRPPSVVYAVSSGSYRLGLRLAEAFGAGFSVNVSAWRDIDTIQKLRAAQCGCRIVSSEPLLTALQSREGTDASRQFLIRPGIQRGTDLACFGEPDRIPTLICTTRLETRFGVHLLIDAVEKIRADGHSFLAFFTGVGRDEDALRQRVADKKLNACVTFASPTAEPADLLRGADVLVLPPGDDDISARPLQAMANGTTVVCCKGGCADYFHDGETAVVCSGRSAASLARGVASLLTDHEFARQLAKTARDYIIGNHAMSAMSESTRAVLAHANNHQTAKVGATA